jgi:hypothetical protein
MPTDPFAFRRPAPAAWFALTPFIHPVRLAPIVAICIAMAYSYRVWTGGGPSPVVTAKAR